MANALRLLLVSGAVAAAASVGTASAFACGSNGYSYAGLAAPQQAFGVSATLTSVRDYDVLNGDVAGWVGVGGPNEGPGGADEWLQVGLSGFPGVTGSDVYYEVERPGSFPAYHQVKSGLTAGTTVKVTVLEMHDRPDWWRVWLNGRAVSHPIRLPDSHERWNPIATAESWDGGKDGACNGFLYHFRRVRIAHAAGGGWRLLSDGSPITSSVTKVRRSPGGAAFLAAEGRAALSLLPSLTP
jgi:hypothetical protein